MEKVPAPEPTTKSSVVPIPDVKQGERVRVDIDGAPPLLGPGESSSEAEDHTARRGAAPAPRVLTVRPAVLLRPVANVRPATDAQWDDSGWESAR